jgi:hypothetical protein
MIVVGQYGNKLVGASSIVLEVMLCGMKSPLSGGMYDAHVHITVLPTDKLADLLDLKSAVLEYEGQSLKIEQLASNIHRDVKAAYNSGEGYSAKSEVIVSTEIDEMKVRVHVAG